MRVRLFVVLSLLFVVGIVGCSQPAPKPAAPATTPGNNRAPHDRLHDRFRHRQRRRRHLPRRDLRNRARRATHGHHAPGHSVLDRRRLALSLRRNSLLSREHSFLIVVDPGVGTSRKAIIAKSKKGQYFVAPDNGVLTPVLDRDGFDSAREITNPNWMIQAAVSSTFQAATFFPPPQRILPPAGTTTSSAPSSPQLVRLTTKTAVVTEKGITGDLIGLDDPFGSLITDIARDDFRSWATSSATKFRSQINKKAVTLPYGKTFMDVPVGDPLLYIDSRGRVGIAINQGNYAKKFNVEVPGTIYIPTKHTPITRQSPAKPLKH